MFKKLICLVAFAASVASCTEDAGLTSVTEANTLDKGKPFEASALMDGMRAQTRGILMPSTQADLDANGFNVTMFSQTATNMWKQGTNTTGVLKFTKGDNGYTNKDAMWTQAGSNDLYAVYSYQNSCYYDQSAAMHLVGGGDVYPLDGDPVVGHYKGYYAQNIPFTMYHIAAQVWLKVENKSDFDIRVAGEINNFYAYHADNFTWKEPVDYQLSDGTTVKKLPNSCWKADESNYVSAALGTTAGSVVKPFTKNDGTKSLTRVNMIPILYDKDSKKTQVKFTIYWQQDGEDKKSVIVKDVEKLQAGVCSIYKLNIEGTWEPKATVSNVVNVDEFSDNTVEWTTNPWKLKTYSVKYESNDETMGSVSSDKEQLVEEGNTVTSTATPKSGYKFIKWSDGVTTATRTDKITKPLNVKAIFGTYKQLYVQTNTAFQVTDADKMEVSEDGHTWTKVVTVSGATGLVIPTGNTFSSKVLNKDASAEGKLKLLDPTETYVYIPITDGTWIVTVNDKTLKYTIVNPKEQLKKLVDLYNTKIGDIDEYVNVTDESKAECKSAIANATKVLGNASATVQEQVEAYNKLKYAWDHIETKDGEANIEPPIVE